MDRVLLFIYRWDEFDEPLDGVVYGVALALGFATVENVLCVVRDGLGVGAPARALRRAGARAVRRRDGLLPRARQARARSPASRARHRVASVAAASRSRWWCRSLFHGGYDFALVELRGAWIYGVVAALSLALWVFVLRRVHRAQTTRRSRPGDNEPSEVAHEASRSWCACVLPAAAPRRDVRTRRRRRAAIRSSTNSGGSSTKGGAEPRSSRASCTAPASWARCAARSIRRASGRAPPAGVQGPARPTARWSSVIRAEPARGQGLLRSSRSAPAPSAAARRSCRSRSIRRARCTDVKVDAPRSPARSCRRASRRARTLDVSEVHRRVRRGSRYPFVFVGG